MKKLYTRKSFKTKEDWLANGRAIGGSSAAAILGMSPWQSKLELYNQLVNGTRDSDTTNSSMAYGVAMEPLMRKQFTIDFPEYAMRAPKGYEVYRSTTDPLFTATVDGLLTEIATGRKGIWECKTHEIRNREDAEEWENGMIPPNYKIQVLHYFLVLNDCRFAEITARLRYYSFDGTSRYLRKVVTMFYHIERDEVEEELNYLYLAEREFAVAVTNRLPPDGEIKF